MSGIFSYFVHLTMVCKSRPLLQATLWDLPLLCFPPVVDQSTEHHTYTVPMPMFRLSVLGTLQRSSDIFRHLQTRQFLVSTPQQMPPQVLQQMPLQVPRGLQKVLQVLQVERAEPLRRSQRLQAPLWENGGAVL